MLSRTASELYWMARYLERAETIARVLDVTNKLSMMPLQQGEQHELRVPLHLTGKQAQFDASYPIMSMQHLVYFFALDSTNDSSIYSCIQMAWNNAHAVRGRLSSEVWESINATWIEMKNIRRQGIDIVGADAFFDWTKERSHLFRGAMFGTLLRGDAMAFIRLGTLIERADSTARLIDVKTALLNADEDAVRNYYRMDMLLRAVSAREAYHSLYQQPLCDDGILELLILRNEIPRSLLACIDDIIEQLHIIDRNAKKPPHQHADALHHQLRYSQLSDIKHIGLQPWIAAFLTQINLVSHSIHQTYLEAQ
jgi:uncharacterized alpha-E superfamily protein